MDSVPGLSRSLEKSTATYSSTLARKITWIEYYSDRYEPVSHYDFELHFPVMLSTFSCAYSPSVCHLWKNVYSGPLSIFKSFFFFFNKELYEFFIYCGHQPLIGDIFCKYLLQFSRFPFHFLVVSFTVKKVFSLT